MTAAVTPAQLKNTTITPAQLMNPAAANFTQANPFQPAGPLAQNADPGTTNRGICTLTHNGNVFRFRTNPNSVWWTYELITRVEQTYGGRVVQVLGTRLDDLSVKVECGAGGWDYLMSMVYYLRNVLSDQRGGETATFEYTTRSWKLKVYSLNLPFQDDVTATTREVELQFKIQEDVSQVISASTLNAELSALQEGIYRPSDNIRNEFNDASSQSPLAGGGANAYAAAKSALSSLINNMPYDTSAPTNTVDTSPQGSDPTGTAGLGLSIQSLSGLPILGPAIAGLVPILNSFTGAAGGLL